MKYPILILLFAIFACQNNQKSDIEEQVIYFIDNHKVIVKEKKMKGHIVETNLFYEKNSDVLMHKTIKIDGIEIQEHTFRDGKLIKIENLLDSSYSYFYSDGSLKRYDKKCSGVVMYSNSYDSISKKPIDFYRNPDEELKKSGDIIIIRPYFPCSTIKIEDFEITIILGTDSNKVVLKQKGKFPEFKINSKKYLSWTKIVCDSIGCDTIPVKLVLP